MKSVKENRGLIVWLLAARNYCCGLPRDRVPDQPFCGSGEASALISLALSQAMAELLKAPEVRRQMSCRSLDIAVRVAPREWAEGLVRAAGANSGEGRG